MADDYNYKPDAAIFSALTPNSQPGETDAKGNRALAEQHLQRGLDYYDRQEFEQALAAYEECVQTDPTFAIGYNNLGMALIDLERYDEALMALQQSIRCDPDYAEAHNNLGFILRRFQRNVEAASAYARFLELEPDIEESARICDWMRTVMEEANLTVIPPFTLPPVALLSAVAPASNGSAQTASAPTATAPTNAVVLNEPSLERFAESNQTEVTNEFSSVAVATQSDDAKAIHCELCLRLFSENEIKQHEGKAMCSNCLAIMGDSSVPAPTLMTNASNQSSQTQILAESQTRRKSKGLAILGVMSVLIAALGVLYYLGRLNPILQKLGVLPPPQQASPDDGKIEPPPPSSPEKIFDGSKIKIINEPQAVVMPFVRWTYTPTLAGTEELATIVPDAQISYTLKDPPEGMILDATHTVTWIPKPTDFDALKKGMQFRTEMVISGTDGANRHLFLATMPIILRMQFGYELHPALDLSIDARMNAAWAVADLNSDGLVDLVAAAGEFSRGWVRVYLRRLDNPLPTPTQLITGGRFSAIYAGDLDGNGTDALLATNWQSGELIMFHQEAQQLVQGSKLKIGPGPVALAVSDMDNDKKMEIAALLGMGGRLVITSFTPAPMRSFSAPISVPLPLSGAQGNVFAWNSASAGPGFLVVLPLAEKPLQYVAWNKGLWDKGGAPIASDIGASDLIIAATPFNETTGVSRRLAVIVGGETCQLLVFAEQGGRFTVVGKPLVLPASARNLLVCDFNGDGQEDLFIIGSDQSGFYFSLPDGVWMAGPQFHHAPQMLGPAVLFHKTPQGPELLLLDVERKGHFLKPVIVENPLPESAPLVAPSTPTEGKP
ncbi:MAG: tetratricopeptide repeat protein [Planctomycetota bacterium]